MSLLNKGASAIDKKLGATGKAKRLNPDAAEFLPFALYQHAESLQTHLQVSAILVIQHQGKQCSTDHSHLCQMMISLPTSMMWEKKNLEESVALLFHILSIADVNGISSFLTSTSVVFVLKVQDDLSPHQINRSSFQGRIYRGAHGGTGHRQIPPS
ncbi:hypothetical protein OSB04_014699 [Centaurea solstitialis]|uniref:Uncharacterized protein n=1 Tax=Centaurea solstitialis TaxID=347529 RepID=A0AA38WHZ8_9ASTR|nr:hypothetical protein OSB04_014699 [Centaurea solstitialis]